MAKKKKKKSQGFTIIVLFLVVIALTISYFIAKNYTDKKEAEEEASKDVKLVNVDTSKAKSLTYSIEGVTYTLIKEDGVWKVESEKERPLDQDTVQSMIDRFKDMTATKEVYKNKDHLADLNLENPVLNVTLTMEDGATYAYSTGANVNSSDGGVYAIVQGFDGIYILPKGYFTLFSKDLNNITEVASITDITADNITRIYIKKDGKELINAKKTQANGKEVWKITAPYDPSVAMDNNYMSALNSNYTTYKFIKNVDYNCTDFGKYGLKDPDTIIDLDYVPEDSKAKDKSQHRFTLYVGNKTDDGSYYYVRVNDSKSVYTIATTSIATFTNIKAFNYVRERLVDTSISNVTKASFKLPGTTYDLTVEGSSDDSKVYKINGEVKDGADIGKFFSKVTLLEIGGEIEKDVDTSKQVFGLSVMNQDNNAYTYTFYAYDDSYYAIEHEGHMYFLVDKRRVEDVITALKEL